MQKRIAVGYVWRLESIPGGNIGDYSITPGLATMLNRHFPEYRITAISQHSIENEPELAIRNNLKGFPECDVVGDVPAGAYRATLSRLQQECGGTLPSVNSGNIDIVFDRFATGVIEEIKHRHPKFLDLMRETRLLIYNSGMILVYGDGTLANRDFWGYSIRRSMPLLTAWKLGIPYGIYAHSFDSFGEADGPGRPYFKKLLEDARFVFCRDGDSVKYIQSLGINAPHLMFIPDSTLSLDRRDKAWANALMARHGLASRQFLAVIPRTWQGGGVISSAIGRERSLSHMEKMRDIICRWIHHTGLKVVIGAEVGRDLPNAREFVYDKLPADIREKCVFLDDYWTTEQAVALYEHTRILVTMEFHSFLMAIPQATPTIVPTFKQSGRKIWMVDDFKLPDWRFDIDEDSAEQIWKTIARIHDTYPRQIKRLETEVIPHLRNLEHRAMDIIGQSLANS